MSAGSVYELLRRSPEVVFDEHIFHAGLIYDAQFADVLAGVFRSYIDRAVASGLSIAIGTATWRANEERIRASVFSERAVNEDNVRFLNDIRNGYAESPISILIEGDIGPRGDAYKPDEALDTDSASKFHAHQIERLASCNVDYLQASTIPAVSARPRPAPGFVVSTMPRLPLPCRSAHPWRRA
ncbi:MAG: homocysteine S-methyltransferase family protein [Gammaproteobacteria bacterium]|nr:homocysteine S-methyltransferase family protein [Gammaproteobacteria bacterium]